MNERGELQAIYWGPRVQREADFSPARSLPEVASVDLSTTTTPQEYPGWGSELYTEPALKATYADGNRDVVLHFVQQHIDGETLEIELKDVASALDVHLYYRVFAANNIIQRWSRIENRTDQAITLESAQSAAWTLPRGEGYGWHSLTGHWGAEGQLHSAPVQTGYTSHRKPPGQHLAPGESMVCHRPPRSNNRGERAGVVWRAGLERELAHHRGAKRDAAIARHRRI